MTACKQIKTTDNKIEEKKKLNMIQNYKLLEFQIYHQELLVNMNS